MRLLVTGANGFVGQALCQAAAAGFQVVAATRQTVGNIDERTDWTSALQGVDVVIHLAARVHVMHDTAADPLAEFRRINTAGSTHLARCAAQSGVKRLVYVSSIKVNGEASIHPFCETDRPTPQDPYGQSKWEAEQALQHIAQQTGLEVVIVRPPLVYGPGVKGNFISLFRAVARGLPLPLAGAANARSLLYVGNLVDALLHCATKPQAAGQTYLLSDGEPVSTAQLIAHIASALQRPNRNFYLPPRGLSACARLLGRGAAIERLLGSLCIDDRKIRQQLNWTPPYSLQQGLAATARWFLQKN